jgi:DNA-binding transcriptional LysR family regulator
MLDQRILTYLSVVDHGSFTQTAKTQFRSTVAVMKQISALEKELGVKLLIRTHRGVVPTAAGKYFYAQAQQLAMKAQQVTQQVKEIDQQTAQIIRIGTSLLRPSDELVKRWLKLSDHSKEFTLQLVPFVDQFGTDQDRILTPQMDCILTPYSVKSWQKYYDYLPLGAYRCEIGIPRRHPLANKVSLTWADLEGQRILLLKKGTSAVVDQIRAEIERHPHIHITDLNHLYDIDSFNRAIQTNSLIEIPNIWHDVNPEVKAVPMTWDYQIPYGLLYRKKPTQSMQSFITMLKKLI